MPVPLPSPIAPAVVTGASSGIGIALSRALARRGYSVILVARRKKILNELADELRVRHSVETEVRVVDLADPAQLAELGEELSVREIAILCCNAGVANFGAVAELDPESERRQVLLNVNAVHDLTLAVLPRMVARGNGGILMVGSAAGNTPIPHNATYSATKAFVNSFSESLRVEVKNHGVNVTLLAPGPVRPEIPVDENSTAVDKLVPDFLWHSTENVAEMAIDALVRNKMRVVPGVMSKAMSLAGNYSPRGLAAPIIGTFYKKIGEAEAAEAEAEAEAADAVEAEAEAESAASDAAEATDVATAVAEATEAPDSAAQDPVTEAAGSAQPGTQG